jgi:hypothetical protein
MERQTMIMVRSGVLAVGLSFIMYWIAASSTLFIVPLLFFAPRFQSSRWALLPVGAVALLLTGYQLVGFGGVLVDGSVIGALLVGLYMPISLLAGAGIWIGLQGRGMLVKLLAGSLFAALFGMGLVLWLSGGSQW